MKLHVLGRTDLRVSEISLGTVEIGMDYGIFGAQRPSESEAGRLLHGALDLGINFIDTARAYGESESIIGRVLSSRRDSFVLVSKVQVADSAAMTASVDETLRQLRTEYLDVLMLHSAPAAVIEDHELRSFLAGLQKQGRIRFTGVSVYGNEAALAAIRSNFYDCVQIACSALDRRPETIAAESEKCGVGLIARSVLLKGVLTNRSSSLPAGLAPLTEAVVSLRCIADDAGLSLQELAYRYVLGTGAVQSALVGASTLHEAEQAVQFAESGPLAEEIRDRIAALPQVNEHYLNPGNWPV